MREHVKVPWEIAKKIQKLQVYAKAINFCSLNLVVFQFLLTLRNVARL